MPSTVSSVPCLWLRITLLVLSFFALHCQGAPLTGPDEYACNVCRESPEGERVLINPGKSFTQSSGRKTTCGELQEWVQDVQPSGGSPGEAELCGLTQYLAWFYLCDCEGPDIPSPIDNVKVSSVLSLESISRNLYIIIHHYTFSMLTHDVLFQSIMICFCI